MDVTTVKALLRPSALAELHHAALYFCASAECDAVYFSDEQVFRTGDVRVLVWQKQPPGERTVCYCFGENERDMQHEIEQHGRTAAVDRVRRHISERRCACDLRNPRGTCCLGDLTAAVKRLSELTV